jgi:hypothetical protein
MAQVARLYMWCDSWHVCKERPVGLLGQLCHVDANVRVGRTGEGGGGTFGVGCRCPSTDVHFQPEPANVVMVN